jgi:hypothetical protein
MASKVPPPTPDVVAQMYQTYLNRAPDQAGFDYWTNAGLDAPALQDAFYNSRESKDINVDDFYKRILGRIGDAPGREYWASNPASTAEIEAEFYRSPEGAERRVPQREQTNAVLPGYLYPGNQFYGKPPTAEWMQAGRSAVEGINRMPGVFSDYGALSSMPGNLAHNMFYPKGTGNLFKVDAADARQGGGKGGEQPGGNDNYSNLAAMFGQLSEGERQNLLAMLLGPQQQDSEF